MTFTAAAASDPWAWTDGNGTYVGRNGQVWLYRHAPTGPHEETAVDDTTGSEIVQALAAIAEPLRAGDWAWVGDRDVHLLRLTWDEPVPNPSQGPVPAGLRSVYATLLPRTAVLVGVRLTRMTQPRNALSDLFSGNRSSELIDFDLDRHRVEQILDQNGFMVCGPELRARLERWFHEQERQVTRVNGSPLRFAKIEVDDVSHPWVTDMYSHRNAPKILSVRAQLTSAVGRQVPVLTGTSVLVGYDPGDGDPTEPLEGRLGVTVTALDGQLLAAVGETLPCSPWRVTSADPGTRLGLSMVRSSGLAAVASGGDEHGCLAGVSLPDLQPVLWDPAQNLTVITGDRGTGRTFLAATLASQAALMGCPTMYLTGSGDEHVRALADKIGGTVIDAADLARPGSLDPFRWLPADKAGPVLDRVAAVVTGVDEDVVRELREQSANAADLYEKLTGVTSAEPDGTDDHEPAVAEEPEAPVKRTAWKLRERLQRAATHDQGDEPFDDDNDGELVDVEVDLEVEIVTDDDLTNGTVPEPSDDDDTDVDGDVDGDVDVPESDGGNGDGSEEDTSDVERLVSDAVGVTGLLVDAVFSTGADGSAPLTDDIDAPFVVIDTSTVPESDRTIIEELLTVYVAGAVFGDDGGVLVADGTSVHDPTGLGAETHLVAVTDTTSWFSAADSVFLLQTVQGTEEALMALGLAPNQRRVMMLRSSSPPHREGDEQPTWALMRDRHQRIVPLVVGTAPDCVRDAFGLEDPEEMDPAGTFQDQVTELLDVARSRGMEDLVKVLSSLVDPTT